MSEPDGERLVVRFKRLRPGAREPRRATPGASGFDLCACLPNAGFVDVAAEPVRIPTGIAIEVPPGSDVQIRPRSGLSAWGVMGTFGTVDADYRGELFVTLYTTGRRPPHRVVDGDRIAQIVVARLAPVDWREADDLAGSERGAGGHGSTGR